MTEINGISKQDALDNFAVFASLFTDEGFYDDIHHELCMWLNHHTHNFDKDRGLLATVILPRGFLKSHICSTLYPLWLVTRDENERILIVSNTTTNASNFLAKIRTTVQKSDLYQAWFSDRIPKSFRHGRWSDSKADLLRNKAGDTANFEVAGASTQVISRHYTTIIEDDTVAPELDDMTMEMAMPTLSDIEQAIGFHKLTTSLLETIGKGKRFVVATRWTASDLMKYVHDKEKPVKFEKRCMEEDNYTYDPSTQDFVGEVTPTYPKRFNRTTLAHVAGDYGTYYFNTLYMNNPMRPEDLTFRVENLGYFTELPDEYRYKITVDPSGLAAKKDGDYDAIVGCAHVPGRIYVDKYIFSHFRPSELVREILDLAIAKKADEILIESVIYQKALYYSLKDEMNARGVYFRVTPIQPHRSKETRIMALEPWVENGALYIRKGMRELYTHLMEYPYGKVLDLLDALAYQIVGTKAKPRRAEAEITIVKPWLTMGQYMDSIRSHNKSPYPTLSGLN